MGKVKGEGRKRGKGVNIRVNNAHHPQLAMHALRAVVPNRLGVVDEDGEDRGQDAVGGHEAGEEALHGGHDVLDGCAGVREGGLHDGVVLQETVLVPGQQEWRVSRLKEDGRT